MQSQASSFHEVLPLLLLLLLLLFGPTCPLVPSSIVVKHTTFLYFRDHLA
jgi:hypothetical protein